MGRLKCNIPLLDPSINQAQTRLFRKEQLNQIMKLLQSDSLSGTLNCSLAHSGRTPLALSSFLKSTPWIIDSKAFDHMTSLSNLFDLYNPCSGSEKVRIADDSFSSIASKGLIKISKSIDLQSVLHIPKLTGNLLSVNKLSKDSNCRITFFDSYCLFQD